MRGALAAGGTPVAAALCCLAIPLTAGIVGLSGLAAFGANLGFVAIVASALVVAWTVRLACEGGMELLVRQPAKGSLPGTGARIEVGIEPDAIHVF